MKIQKIFLLLFIILNSCILSEEEQVYPKIEFNSINTILIYGDIEKRIIDENKINSLKDIFKDSSNYFFNEKITFQQNKSESFWVDLISKKDTFSFKVYRTANKNKIEIGYLDKIDHNDSKQSRKFNRFYLNSKLLEVLKE